MDYSTFLHFLFLNILLWQNTAAKLDYFNIEACSITADLSGDGKLDRHRHAMLFPDITFNCDGKIGYWEFFAHNTRSVFYAAVFRLDKITGTYAFVGSSTIKPKKIGYQRQMLDTNDRIRVKAGDILGLYYPFANRQPPIIPIQTEGSSLGKYCKYRLGRKDMAIAKNMSLDPNFMFVGRPALQAQVYSTNPNLRLEGGNKRYVGRAEIKQDDVYGTMCDKWFNVRGWPLAFCLEMGYPDIVNATYCKYLGKEYQAKEDVPTHMHNPRCKASQNKTIHNCGLHPNQKCSHDEDVCIECRPRVRLVHPFMDHKDKGEGVPVFYDQGFYSLACDNRPPKWHEDNRNTSWCTAVCREIGFTGFESVQPRDSGKKTGWPMPACTNTPTQPPNLLSQCPPDPKAGKCDHKSYLIRCNTEKLPSWST